MKEFEVKFWGVRGTLSCSGENYQKFGGNTICVSVLWEDHMIIFDMGSGMYDLGQWILKQDRIFKISIFVTHYHLDHIVGYPFFGPAWNKDCVIDLHGGYLEPSGGIENFFTNTLYRPLFPISLKTMSAQVNYHDINSSQVIDLGNGLKIKSFDLNHPGGSLGYKLETPKGNFCYLTDHEHKPGEINQPLVNFAHKSKLVIYDSTYDDDTFAPKIGWGHSSWQEAIRLKNLAEIEKIAIFHHDPSSIDSYLTDLEKKIEGTPEAFVAKQGQTLIF